MNLYKLLISSIVYIFLPICASFNEPAVIIKPIIELTTSLPMLSDLPASPDTAKCSRAHQALYNECIDCIDEKDNFYQVAFKNIIYGFDKDTQKPLNTFWTHKDNILFLKDTPAVIADAIPAQEYAKNPTVVLTYPWSIFSVGTRFKHLPEYDTQESYAIEKIEYGVCSVSLDFVPHEYALLENPNIRDRKALFINTLSNLIDNVAQNFPNHAIPYVWGGSSFINSFKQDDFCLRDGGWHRGNQTTLYTGYDCSELIMRFAQIAGINFPWKTAASIERSLKALTVTDTLENGDIIWVTGHVMLISDIESDELIEARGYGVGYGCIHRITVNQCFDNIENYQQLLDKYFAKEIIRRRNKQGYAICEEHICKILKLHA